MLKKIHTNEFLNVEIGIHEDQDGTFELECRTHGNLGEWGISETEAEANAGKSPEWCLGCGSMLPLARRIKELESERNNARQGLFWFLEHLEECNVYQADIARALMSDKYTRDDVKEEIKDAMLEDAECDHSAGVCSCEVREILEGDDNLRILSQANVNRMAESIRKFEDGKDKEELCSTFNHKWKEEYYGVRCEKCDLFYPDGCAPWEDETI